MPNVLDAEPVRAFARRAGARITHPGARARFEQLAEAALLIDSRNFHPATAADLRDAPDWVARAQKRGDVISVFKLNRSACLRLHALARRIRDACALADLDVSAKPSLARNITEAREFIDKIDRADFDVIRAKAYRFARTFAQRGAPEDETQVCEPRTIATARDRVWSRVTSVAELRALGREFCNCLARTGRSSRYGGGLVSGLLQFWVLREADGAGVMIAMASTIAEPRFYEVNGPRNARIPFTHPDLLRLGRALGMRPSNPPPPPPAGAALRLPPNAAPCVCLRCTQQRRATLLHGAVVAS